MRTTAWTLATFLAAGPALCAQQPATGGAPPAAAPGGAAPMRPLAPPPAAPLDPANNRLDAHLLKWEQAMKGIQALKVQCSRTEKDKNNGLTEVFKGEASYLKPNLALLYLRSATPDPTRKDGQPDPNSWEQYVCTGKQLFEYRPKNKMVTIHDMPQPKMGQVADDSFLSFLFGMKAAETKQRYQLNLVKEDEWYIYLEILPKDPVDKQEFSKAQMVLFAKSFLPRRLWFEHPNGNEVTWDLDRIDTTPSLTPQNFVPPAAPQGWQQRKGAERASGAPAAPATPTGGQPPRVVRPNQ